MRRLLAVLMIPAMAPAVALAGCGEQPRGTARVVVIGSEPKLRDPGQAPLGAADAVLVANVAQGLVRFDAGGNIVGGLAERWNVSDDGMSYIFRLATTNWSGGGKVSAQQVARILKRSTAPASRNPLRDALGSVADVVAMTDRVIEIRLKAPRPNLLTLLAQPELAIVRSGRGTGPFAAEAEARAPGELKLTREISSADGEDSRREEVLLAGAQAETAVRAFAGGNSELVLGGTFADLPLARRVRLPRGTLRFDPASGLFGLVAARADSAFAGAAARRLLNAAIDRNALLAAFDVPGLAARTTLLEPGLEGMPPPVQPPWFTIALADRRPVLQAEADRQFGGEKPAIRLYLPDGPGADMLLDRLAVDWGSLGFSVERARSPGTADLKLVDAVAPSTSAAWFLRQFHCGAVPVCDPETDKLLDAARQTLVPAQRYALLAEAAARMDDAHVFMPLAAPVRWALVARRIAGFAGNRYARHTLTDLEQRLSPGSQ